MNYNNLLQNSIFSYQTYKDFDALNNLTKEELRVFINLVTIHGNINGDLLNDNNISDCIRLFLLDTNGYTDVQLFFSLNILIYLGDLYQKKALEEFVFTSFEDLNEDNRLSWLLTQGFRTEILNTNGQPIELNWGVKNFDTPKNSVTGNPYTSEINYEEYIRALELIFEKLAQRVSTEIDDTDLIEFINYTSTTLQVDKIIDFVDTVENRTIKLKITQQILGNIAITSQTNTGSGSESFIGYRQIDKPIQRKKNVKEGFTSINSYIKPISITQNSNEKPKKYNINSENILRFYEKIPDTLSTNKIGKNVVKQTISIDSRHRNNYY